jgi:hypothetical protein
MAHNLFNELQEAAMEQFVQRDEMWAGWPKYVFKIITRDRNCDKAGKFTNYQQGFTPKEHKEMMDRKEMLEWQAKREEADREWRSKEEWKRNWFMAGVAIVAVILGIILGHFIS